MQPNLHHLAGHLGLVELRVRRLLARTGRASSTDPLGALVISPERVERVLGDPIPGPPEDSGTDHLDADADGLDAEASAAEAEGADIRLLDLARRFDLVRLDLDLLLIASAPDLDARFAVLFAYLQDDFSARQASVGLALELLDCSPLDAFVRSRLQRGSPLIDGGLLNVADPALPLLQRRLLVPDRVVMHVLGDDALDPAVRRHVVRSGADVLDGAAALGKAIYSRSPIVYLRELEDGAGVAHAVAGLDELGQPALAVDLVAALAQDDDHVVEAAVRDARLLGAGLVVPHADELAATPGAIDWLCRSARPLVLVGSTLWDPTWSEVVPLCVDLPTPSRDGQRILWENALRDAGEESLDDFEGLAGFALSPTQVVRTAEYAAQRAGHAGHDLSDDDLREAARRQNSAAILSLARRIEPSASWDDLIVTNDVQQQLRELLNRVKLGPQVLDRWDMRSSTRRGDGVRALFCGPPGTGKTLAAEVIAGELGLDLFVIDLSSVVDKYIGETEKHLERMFQAASEANGILFFDEADALFGKRSEVQDAKDRYANIETSYLLQRLDTFRGFVVLATNLRANLDDAFFRRLDVVVEIRMPGVDERLAIWDRSLGPHLPRADDVDLAFLAKSFVLPGGSIRNIALTAAFFAAEGDGHLRMEDLIWGVQREYRKMGRLTTEPEFGPWWSLIGTDLIRPGVNATSRAGMRASADNAAAGAGTVSESKPPPPPRRGRKS